MPDFTRKRRPRKDAVTREHFLRRGKHGPEPICRTTKGSDVRKMMMMRHVLVRVDSANLPKAADWGKADQRIDSDLCD
jgi:hypothetical protein